MKESLILNPIITKKYINKQKEFLKSKILHIKPIVDSTCPECYYYVKNRFNKTQRNNFNRFSLDDEEKKIKYNSRDKKFKNKFHPLFKYEHNYLTYSKIEELVNVAIENHNIFKRLNAKKGFYNYKNQLRDYEKAQYYKKNYCKFPSIDFYRTRKSNTGNLCPIFNYCTFNNYKKINNKFINEVSKKTNNQLHKAKSSREIFNDKSNRKKLIKISKLKIKYNIDNFKINIKSQNKSHNKDKIDKLENNLSKNYVKDNNTKHEEINKKNFSLNKEEKDIWQNKEQLNNNIEKENEIIKKEEEKSNKDIEDINIYLNEDSFIKKDNNNLDVVDINKKNSKEEISEKNDKEVNLIKQDANKINQEEKKSDSLKESNNNKNSYLIKEDEEIEENITNSNNINDKNINEKVEFEKNKIDKDDEFISIF